MKLEWDDTFSIGNEKLDSQHKKWITLYNRLDSLMQQSSHEELVQAKAEVLKEMSDYVDYHFDYEEEYMRSVNFPEIDKHWRMHKDFRTKMYSVYRQHLDGNLVLNSEVMDMIHNWLIDHIIKQDVKIMHFLQSSEK